jgi:transcriptional regulator with XRE-family HTH domain
MAVSEENAQSKDVVTSAVSIGHMNYKKKATTESYDEYVGKRLREARQISGLSQSALGRHVGLTFQQVQKHENGSVRISAGRLLAFARALNIPIGFFFDGIEPDGATEDLLDRQFLDLSEFSEVRSSCIKIIAGAEEGDVAKLANFLEHFVHDTSDHS